MQIFGGMFKMLSSRRRCPASAIPTPYVGQYSFLFATYQVPCYAMVWYNRGGVQSVDGTTSLLLAVNLLSLEPANAPFHHLSAAEARADALRECSSLALYSCAISAILLFCNLCAGWGVVSADFSLAGRMSEAKAKRGRRGCSLRHTTLLSSTTAARWSQSSKTSIHR